MAGAYVLTPEVWPPLVAALFIGALGVYSWRHRTVPAALPLAAASVCAAFWLMGLALQEAAVAPAAKIGWYKFQIAWQLPALTAPLCFALEYAWPGRWLTRRNLALLAIAPVLILLALVFDEARLVWLRLGVGPDGAIVVERTVIGNLFILYAAGVFGLIVVTYAWLFIRAPQYRWPVVLLLVGICTSFGLHLLEVTHLLPQTEFDPTVAVPLLNFLAFFLALFGFRIFDPLPVARIAALEQMRDGIVVFDPRWRVSGLNRTAAGVLGMPAARARGKRLEEILTVSGATAARLTGEGAAEPVEMTLGTGTNASVYALEMSALRDFRDLLVGHLLFLRDVTEQRRAQARLLEQLNVVATLRERERLARELHDTAGQLLAYVSVQAQAVAKYVHDGDIATAESQLQRLSEAAGAAHADLRESIFSLKAAPTGEWAFLRVLKEYFRAFNERAGMATNLSIEPGLDEADFAPGAGVQLFRVIQEALTNARKHSGASCVSLTLGHADGQAVVVVEDDGAGFDPGGLRTTGQGQPASGGDGHYGIDFMVERMAEIGGRLEIESAPGAGTRLVLHAPMLRSGEGDRAAGTGGKAGA